MYIVMTNRTDRELTASLFCVGQPQGRAHFTSDRRVALDSADDVRELLRKDGLSGVHNVRAQWLDGNVWRDCLVPR